LLALDRRDLAASGPPIPPPPPQPPPTATTAGDNPSNRGQGSPGEPNVGVSPAVSVPRPLKTVTDPRVARSLCSTSPCPPHSHLDLCGADVRFDRALKPFKRVCASGHCISLNWWVRAPKSRQARQSVHPSHLYQRIPRIPRFLASPSTPSWSHPHGDYALSAPHPPAPSFPLRLHVLVQTAIQHERAQSRRPERQRTCSGVSGCEDGVRRRCT
jgi:hypothetical protein